MKGYGHAVLHDERIRMSGPGLVPPLSGNELPIEVDPHPHGAGTGDLGGPAKVHQHILRGIIQGELASCEDHRYGNSSKHYGEPGGGIGHGIRTVQNNNPQEIPPLHLLHHHPSEVNPLKGAEIGAVVPRISPRLHHGDLHIPIPVKAPKKILQPTGAFRIRKSSISSYGTGYGSPRKNCHHSFHSVPSSIVQPL